MATEVMPETEARILDALDREEQDSWLALVRWTAPKLCGENPKLLVEAIHRRARAICSRAPTMDVSERFSILMAECGVRLQVVG